MDSLLKPSVLVALFLLPALVMCDRYVRIDISLDPNCTYSPGNTNGWTTTFSDTSQAPNTSFPAFVSNTSMSFESAVLSNFTGDVVSLVACQAGLECNATGAILIPFNLSAIGACSTAGPPGTQFDKFLIS